MKKLILTLCVCMLTLPAFAADKEKESSFERVMKTRELRCAYTIYPPYFIKNPNDGEFSGLFHDFLENMGSQLGIKIIWTEEVGSDNIFHGLNTNRYDAVCIGYVATPSRANGGSFTKPIIFVPGYIYVRQDETRFKHWRDLNNAEMTFATMDGEFSQIFKNEHLPQAAEMAVPALTQAPERFEMIAGHKADATITESSIGNEYMMTNPGKIKPLGDPAYIGAGVIILAHGEHDLREYLNTAIDSLHYSGTAERIIQEYQKNEGDFLLPLKPYEVTK